MQIQITLRLLGFEDHKQICFLCFYQIGLSGRIIDDAWFCIYFLGANDFLINVLCKILPYLHLCVLIIDVTTLIIVSDLTHLLSLRVVYKAIYPFQCGQLNIKIILFSVTS